MRDVRHPFTVRPPREPQAAAVEGPGDRSGEDPPRASVLTGLRWAAVIVLVGHGLLHLLGAAQGFGWWHVPALHEPVSTAAAALWLLAAVLVIVAAALIAARSPAWWWAVALAAAAVSQAAIVTSWGDASAGTAANLLLVLLAGYGLVSVGPASFRARWVAQAERALDATQATPGLLTEADLAALPAPLAAYVRRSGAVGRPRVTNLEAAFHGRIRGGPSQPWMPFTARQVSTFGPRPQRAFLMEATRSGLPVTVLHQYAAGTATMRARVLSMVTVVNGAGPEMDRGETVTVFNDLVVLAPGAIPGAAVRWSAVDAEHVCGVYTVAGESVTATLTFNADHDLVDFVSADRLRASADGRSFTRQGWSTPIRSRRVQDGRRVLGVGEARWDAPPPEGAFAYIELELDEIAFNVDRLDSGGGGAVRARRRPGLRS